MKKVAILSKLDSDYAIGELLGKGNYAKVHLATKYADNKEYAIKSMAKEKMHQHMRSLVFYTESMLMTTIDWTYE